MPCQSYGPGPQEIEWERLNSFLHEATGKRPEPYVWNAADHDRLAAELCAWCRENDVRACSLELQIWWRDHQRADAARIAAEQATERRRKLRRSAAQKLTPEELDALTRRD